MIEATGLTKAFGKQQVLDSISFSLDKGRVMGILGPNGAGKTTLIKILALITAPDSGRLTYDGCDAIRDSRLLRPMIGYVPQDIALFEDLTVRDNLLCWTVTKGSAAKAQAERLIELLNMTPFALKRISALSGGMKRRVNLAVALLDNPKLLILDEPLVGVDIEQRQQITENLQKLADNGVTQIIASHHVDEMIPLAGDMMVLRDGRVLYHGTSAELLKRRNAHPTAATLDELVLQMLKEHKGDVTT